MVHLVERGARCLPEKEIVQFGGERPGEADNNKRKTEGGLLIASSNLANFGGWGQLLITSLVNS